MAQEAPETVRLTKDAKIALEKIIADLRAKSPVPVSRNAAINYTFIEFAKLIGKL